MSQAGVYKEVKKGSASGSGSGVVSNEAVRAPLPAIRQDLAVVRDSSDPDTSEIQSASLLSDSSDLAAPQPPQPVTSMASFSAAVSSGVMSSPTTNPRPSTTRIQATSTTTTPSYRPSYGQATDTSFADEPTDSPVSPPTITATSSSSPREHLLPGHVALIATFSFLACLGIFVACYWFIIRRWKRREKAWEEEEERRIITEIREAQKRRRMNGKCSDLLIGPETTQMIRRPSKARSVKSWLNRVTNSSDSSTLVGPNRTPKDPDAQTIRVWYRSSTHKNVQELTAEEVARQLPGDER